MKCITVAIVICLVLTPSILAQVNSGELRITVADSAGKLIDAAVQLSCNANGYNDSFDVSNGEATVVKPLPFGIYSIQVAAPGFAPVSKSVEVHSTIPVDYSVQLEVAKVTTDVKVDDSATLLDPNGTASVMQIGSQQIEHRLASLPGRSVQDLVNSQPGWLYEGNAVLHPRGAEYQTQFVVDGIPLTDNRSPSFGPEIEADAADSMTIYTAGIPAEYGRKMGGVVEVNTKRQTSPGLHGEFITSGGSYDTLSGFGQMQYLWGKNTIGGSASGARSDHYLNPVVPENYTNTGTTGDFSGRYERQFTENDRLIVGLRHELSRYLVPNEIVQQQAGQRQNRDNFETMGTVSYQHIFSPDMVGNLAGMVRDSSNDLYSNPLSTPIIATQNNSFREGYFTASVALHHGIQEIKAGIESDNLALHENFSYVITDPTQFDSATPGTFAFQDRRPDLEQAAYLQDMIRLGKWTVSGGLRWDHYQLLLNQNAFSPRFSVSRYFPSAGTVIHFAYDRVFQTPSSENLLLSSSPSVVSLDDTVLRLPVQPSRGNYYEGGLTKGLFNKLRVDANVFRRDLDNYADDDQLLNTAVSFPVAFRKAVLYGADGKLDLIAWGKLSGFVSYSYIVGNAWYPVTGGLFLGSEEVTGAETQLTGHFPDSQDQRNTVRTRFQYQLVPRIQVAGGAQYDSGLPFQFNGAYQDAVDQYGQQVVDRVNFDRSRVRPQLSLSASLGADLYTSDKLLVHMQADGENLNNRLNLIDFNGLFSFNAIAPARSFNLRLTTTF